jgi:group I intron endonuclease
VKGDLVQRTNLIRTKSGVYLIRHIESTKVYVGSAIDVELRFKQHRSMLRRGKHHSPHLQNAWSLYGEDAFEFVIYLETLPTKTALLATEQRALDRFAGYSYNCCPKAHSRQGDTQSAKTKQILREIGQATAATPEGRAHILAMTRLAQESPEARLAMREAILRDSNSAKGRKRRSRTATRLHREGKLGGSSEEMRRRYLLTARARRIAELEVTSG